MLASYYRSMDVDIGQTSAVVGDLRVNSIGGIGGMILMPSATRATIPDQIVHSPGTSNFRCPCGERLVFSTNRRAFTSLDQLIKEGAMNDRTLSKVSSMALRR